MWIQVLFRPYTAKQTVISVTYCTLRYFVPKVLLMSMIVLLQRFLEKTKIPKLYTVSYTHLTLPTNREV